MFIRRNYSYYNGDEAIQKEFGLFGFLTGTGANAYETRRDLGNGYTEVTKNTLGDKISNFFNGTKKVRNQGYVPGVNETSYRDGGIFTKIGNKAEAGFNSMKNTANNVKNSISNTLKSSNAMTPTGSIPKRMTKNPQATQLELFNRDGSPAFKNKPALKRIQPRQSAAIGGPLGKSGGRMTLRSPLSSRYGELMKEGANKLGAPSKRDLFNQKKAGNRNASPADLRDRWLREERLKGNQGLKNARTVATAPSNSLRKVSNLAAKPIQAQPGGLLRSGRKFIRR